MIESFSKGNSKDKKMLAEAQQMLADSKAKIEYLKMRMAKMKQSSRSVDAASNNGEPLVKGILKVKVFIFQPNNQIFSFCRTKFQPGATRIRGKSARTASPATN
jgi:hypothetical protein